METISRGVDHDTEEEGGLDDVVSWPVYAAFIAHLTRIRTASCDEALKALGNLGRGLPEEPLVNHLPGDDHTDPVEELPLSNRTLERLDALVEAISEGTGSVQLPALDPFLDPLRPHWEAKRIRGIKESIDTEGTGMIRTAEFTSFLETWLRLCHEAWKPLSLKPLNPKPLTPTLKPEP